MVFNIQEYNIKKDLVGQIRTCRTEWREAVCSIRWGAR